MTHATYDHPSLPLSVDYIYDTGEPSTGIPPSVQITAIWHQGVDVTELLVEVNTNWVARLEEKIKASKTLF